MLLGTSYTPLATCTWARVLATENEETRGTLLQRFIEEVHDSIAIGGRCCVCADGMCGHGRGADCGPKSHSPAAPQCTCPPAFPA